MADRSSPSPARRPHLNERHSSGQSLSRASPSAHVSTSHKGSSQRLHKTHAVGHHGRHPHGRVPSHGKNLNRLPKQSTAHTDDSQSKHYTQNKSDDLSSSPTAQNMKRNSSKVNLPRTGSKVSIKKSSSGVGLQHRTGSAAKLGKGARTDKLQHQQSKKDNGALRPSKAKPKFSVGSDGQDEDWTEESPSPRVTRQISTPQRAPPPTDLPSPDDPPGRSPTTFPHSPPQSPPPQKTTFADKQIPQPQQPPARFSRPPDAEIVTSRLLSKHGAAPCLSSISATITPTGSNASPAFHSSASSHVPPTKPADPSLPPDGISRFLHPAGSSGSGSAASNSITHLQSTLAALHREQHRKAHSPYTSSPPPTGLDAARRARSAADLTHSQLETSSSHSLSPPPSRNQHTSGTRASPFESAAPKAPSKSLTQLKLDLQRISSGREDSQKESAPRNLLNGSHAQLGITVTVGAENEKERRERQWSQARRELRNAQRFDDIILRAVERLEKRGIIEKKRDGKGDGERRDGKDRKAGSLGRSAGEGSRPPSRGRVRFEVGRNDFDEDDEDDEDDERALLRRMWEADGVGEVSNE